MKTALCLLACLLPALLLRSAPAPAPREDLAGEWECEWDGGPVFRMALYASGYYACDHATGAPNDRGYWEQRGNQVHVHYVLIQDSDRHHRRSRIDVERRQKDGWYPCYLRQSDGRGGSFKMRRKRASP